MSEHDERFDEALLDLAGRTNEQLREMLNDLHEEEQRISYRRRVLHGRIDILRAELVGRLKANREAGKDVISGSDIDKLIGILASDLRGVSDVDVAADEDE